MQKIHSCCLPYFSQDMVSVFLLDGKEIRIPIFQFEDIASEGGRFYQFYTFLIGGDENVQSEDKGGFDSGNIPGGEGIGIKNDYFR